MAKIITLNIELTPEANGTRLAWRQVFDSGAYYQKFAEFVAV